MIYFASLTSNAAGSEVKLDVLVYEPPRHGPTLWEIGIPDRTAGEFNIPDPYPTLMNRLYNDNHLEKLVTYTNRHIDTATFKKNKKQKIVTA